LGVVEIRRWVWWVHGDTGWMWWKLNIGGNLGGGGVCVVDELAEGRDFL
jgi:hypothetical protein